MTGWRVGYIIAHPELISVFQYVNDGLTYVAPSRFRSARPSRRSNCATKLRTNTLRSTASRVYYAADCIETNARTLTHLSGRAERSICSPESPKRGWGTANSARFCWKRRTSSFRPDCVFGQAGQGHFRIACTVSQEKLAEAMQRHGRAAAANFEVYRVSAVENSRISLDKSARVVRIMMHVD